MKEYEAHVYDVVTVLNINESENLKQLEIKEKVDYMVSYVFADGSCVLYKEHQSDMDELAVYEYIVESEDVKHLSYLYNYMDEESFYDYKDCYDGDMVLLNASDYTWTSHDLKIGDYVYFENVQVVKLYQEAGLKNNHPYQITAFSELNNCPFIMTDIGEFELYPLEVAYLKNYDNDAEKEIESKTDRVTVDEIGEISTYLDDLAFNLSMDKALEEGNYEKAQQILDLHNAKREG